MPSGKAVKEAIERFYAPVDPLEFWSRVAQGLPGVPLEPEDVPGPAEPATDETATTGQPRVHPATARRSRRRLP